ncbi:MAG: hypothetical protein AABX11_04545 [Nanoarchaeota archaeon]
MVYANVTLIVLQKDKGIGVEIIKQEIADSFKGYFDEYWAKSKPFRI